MPDVSVVIPSFNQAAFLPDTLASVLGQDTVSVEVFIADGGSTDGTVAFLRSLADPRVTWVSEPDRGQAHAVNKGLTRVRGDIIGWLNSDDLYEPGALAAVVRAFDQNPQAQWLVGRCRIVDAHGSEVRRGVTAYKDRRLRRFRYERLLVENFVCQPAVFWRRSIGQRVGPLDESLHYAMDYDLWLRMGTVAEPLVLDQVLARFRYHGASKSSTATRRQFAEQFAVAKRYLQGRPFKQWCHRWQVMKILAAYGLMRWFGR